jgi:hypothetical protein
MKTTILLLVSLLSYPLYGMTHDQYFGGEQLMIQQLRSKPAVTVTLEQLEMNQLLIELNKKECNPKVYKHPLRVVNRIGAAGKWQLTAIARKAVGYKGTLKEFLNSEKIQRQCVLALINLNKKYINYYIPNWRMYIGKSVHGVVISYSGMLMAAHLAGVGGLKRFLCTSCNPSDGNESVKSYMNHFRGYMIV